MTKKKFQKYMPKAGGAAAVALAMTVALSSQANAAEIDDADLQPVGTPPVDSNTESNIAVISNEVEPAEANKAIEEKNDQIVADNNDTIIKNEQVENDNDAAADKNEIDTDGKLPDPELDLPDAPVFSGDGDMNVGDYNEAVDDYNDAVGDYNDAVDEYNKDVDDYNDAATKQDQEAQKAYEDAKAAYDAAYEQYLKDLEQYEGDKAEYDTNSQAYQEYLAAKEAYDAAYEQYLKDKEAYDDAKAEHDTNSEAYQEYLAAKEAYDAAYVTVSEPCAAECEIVHQIAVLFRNILAGNVIQVAVLLFAEVLACSGSSALDDAEICAALAVILPVAHLCEHFGAIRLCAVCDDGVDTVDQMLLGDDLFVLFHFYLLPCDAESLGKAVVSALAAELCDCCLDDLPCSNHNLLFHFLCPPLSL